MDTPLTEKLQQMESNPPNDEGAIQEELPQPRRDRRKRGNENLRKSVTFKWSWDLDARLEHYLADRSLKEHRDVDRTEVVVQAVEEFLNKEGY